MSYHLVLEQPLPIDIQPVSQEWNLNSTILVIAITSTYSGDGASLLSLLHNNKDNLFGGIGI
jgi:hypothetical protein